MEIESPDSGMAVGYLNVRPLQKDITYDMKPYVVPEVSLLTLTRNPSMYNCALDDTREVSEYPTALNFRDNFHEFRGFPLVHKNCAHKVFCIILAWVRVLVPGHKAVCEIMQSRLR